MLYSRGIAHPDTHTHTHTHTQFLFGFYFLFSFFFFAKRCMPPQHSWTHSRTPTPTHLLTQPLSHSALTRSLSHYLTHARARNHTLTCAHAIARSLSHLLTHLRARTHTLTAMSPASAQRKKKSESLRNKIKSQILEARYLM